MKNIYFGENIGNGILKIVHEKIQMFETIVMESIKSVDNNSDLSIYSSIIDKIEMIKENDKNQDMIKVIGSKYLLRTPIQNLETVINTIEKRINPSFGIYSYSITEEYGIKFLTIKFAYKSWKSKSNRGYISYLIEQLEKNINYFSNGDIKKYTKELKHLQKEGFLSEQTNENYDYIENIKYHFQTDGSEKYSEINMFLKYMEEQIAA